MNSTSERLSLADLPDRMMQDELAAYWRISPRTLERWRAQGTGPAWIRLEGRVLYRREDVLSHEASRLRRSID